MTDERIAEVLRVRGVAGIPTMALWTVRCPWCGGEHHHAGDEHRGECPDVINFGNPYRIPHPEDVNDDQG